MFPRLDRKVAVVASVGLTAFAFSALLLAWGSHNRPVLRLDVAFSANACCSWQVWVNGTSPKDVNVLPMYPGTEHTYEVPLTVTHVSYLRMPLGQTKGMTVTFRDVRVTRGAHTVAELDPASLPVTTYFASKHVIRHGVSFTSTYTQPFVAAPVSLTTTESSFRLQLAHIGDQPLRGIVALLLLGVLAALMFAARDRRQLIWAFGALLTVLLVRFTPWLSHQFPLRDSVREAVGFASYQGMWKRREQAVLDGAIAVAVLVPVVLCVATRQFARVQRTVSETTSPRLARRWAALLVATPLVVLGLAAAPNLHLLISGPPSYVPSWDSNNFVFWTYLLQKLHLVPMRDFFWPYGFQSLFDARVPWGVLASYLTSLVFWAFLAIGSYSTLTRYFAGRALVVRYLALSSFWVSVTIADYWSFTVRYEGALAGVMLFAAVRTSDTLLSLRRAVFAFSWAAVILLEPAQAIYAAVPIGFLLLTELVSAVPRTALGIGSFAGRSLTTLGVPTAAAVAVFAATGELRGTVRYYENLSAITAQAAFPGRVDHWVTSPSGLQSFLFWSVPLALVLGLFALLTSRDPVANPARVVVALALLGCMMMQKQTVRPGIESQIWLPVVFALAFWAASETRLAALRRASVFAAAAGASAALILVAGDYGSALHHVAAGPGRLSRSVGALLHERAALAASADQAFAPAAFRRFDQYRPVVTALSRLPAVRAGGPVWILGDDSPITVMLGLKWPYYYNDLYDTAPIESQRLVLDRLRNAPPVRVVFNFSTQSMVFDTVPQVVRVPLLFQWAVAHVVPQQTIGNFAILRPRRPGERVPLSWWRKRIGTTVDLGHVPAVAGIPPLQCVGTKPSCGRFLVVTIANGTAMPDRFDIPVTVDGTTFTIRFASASGTHRYVVPLNRLWFWRPEDRAAIRDVQLPTVAGVQSSIERRLVDENALY